jgi:hypothetical protein
VKIAGSDSITNPDEATCCQVLQCRGTCYYEDAWTTEYPHRVGDSNGFTWDQNWWIQWKMHIQSSLPSGGCDNLINMGFDRKPGYYLCGADICCSHHGGSGWDTDGRMEPRVLHHTVEEGSAKQWSIQGEFHCWQVF